MNYSQLIKYVFEATNEGLIDLSVNPLNYAVSVENYISKNPPKDVNGEFKIIDQYIIPENNRQNPIAIFNDGTMEEAEILNIPNYKIYNTLPYKVKETYKYPKF